MKFTVWCLFVALLLSSGTCVYQNWVIEQQSVEIEAQAESYVTLLVYALKVCHK